MGLEFELKFAATPDILRSLKTEFENLTPISMETTYFDTPERSLSRQKMTLRRRFENGRSVCTVKTPAASFGRGEWDVHADWCEDTVRRLFESACIPAVPFDALDPVCGAKFTRLAKTLTLPDCTLEIALDEGILFGGGKEIPLCEVEVELKDGEQEAVIRWAKALAGLYGLQPESRSKFKRAIALLEDV